MSSPEVRSARCLPAQVSLAAVDVTCSCTRAVHRRVLEEDDPFHVPYLRPPRLAATLPDAASKELSRRCPASESVGPSYLCILRNSGARELLRPGESA